MKVLKKLINGIKIMLSFNYLGNLGRLGNQMFQYASLRGIAARRGYDFVIPPRQVFGNIDDNVRGSDAFIYDCFELCDSDKALSEYPRLSESTFGFDENIYYNCPDSIDLFGYFQCEKYFEHIEEDIRKDFTFKEDIRNISNEIFSQLFGNQEVISLHVRRGDYTTNPNHPTQSLEYYEKSLSNFDSDLPVIIFSDDPQWCDEQELFSPDRFFISEGGDTKVDLCLMTLCSYHIIANSSYSWWGSYLAKSKKTIAPSDWFGEELKKTKDTRELYRKDWIVI
jgi:hypothetical protein